MLSKNICTSLCLAGLMAYRFLGCVCVCVCQELEELFLFLWRFYGRNKVLQSFDRLFRKFPPSLSESKLSAWCFSFLRLLFRLHSPKCPHRQHTISRCAVAAHTVGIYLHSHSYCLRLAFSLLNFPIITATWI